MVPCISIYSCAVCLASNCSRDSEKPFFDNNGSNCKCLITSYQASIVSYTYEEGKDDPGSPVISGLDQLEAFENCIGNYSTDCETTVTLNFSSPYTGQNQQSSTATAVQVKQICSPGEPE